MLTIAARLKYARERKGWTQTQLAVAAGVSAGTVGNIESGARQSKGSLPQIAEALCINHKWLASGTGTPDATPTTSPALVGGSAGPVSPALGIEAIANALALMTDEQREAMAGKLASLARAPDSPTLKKSISESLGSAPLPPAPTT